MNLGQGQAHESYLGPPSEVISIASFLTETSRPLSGTDTRDSSTTTAANGYQLDTLSPEYAAIAIECSVDEMKGSLNNVLADPVLMTHVSKTHQAVVHSIYETAESSSRRKRRRPLLPEPAAEHAEVTTLRKQLDAVKLKCWPLTMHAASFIRAPKHSDRNTLMLTKKFGTTSMQRRAHEALVFVSVYNNLSWGHRQLFRSSQHVLSSSQTLGDLLEVIPCTSNEIPTEIENEAGERIGYEIRTDARCTVRQVSLSGIICINGIAYGDGQNIEDYSEKLLKLMSTSPRREDRRLHIEVGPSMRDTIIASLSVQLHKPYWLLHAGNCEHFLVFDQIRLHHPADPPLSDYPLTTHITPPLLDLCRACNKVPAVFAILGDVRLGESPFVICGPCWRWMGKPEGPSGENIMVVPLPKHEHGWCKPADPFNEQIACPSEI